MVLLMDESTPLRCRAPCIWMWLSGLMSWAVRKISCQRAGISAWPMTVPLVPTRSISAAEKKPSARATRSKCLLIISSRSPSMTFFTMTMEKYGSQPEAQSAIMDTVPVGWMEVRAALRRAG